jgi:hypothetical protein
VPEIIDLVFAKTSQNARFLLSENERFGLVFVKTGTFWYGSEDPCLCHTDPDLDPSIFVINLLDANKKLI